MSIETCLQIIDTIPIPKRKKSGSQQQRIVATALDKKGRIIGVGSNSYKKTHPIMKELAFKAGLDNAEHKLFLHAEIQAILKAGDQNIDTICVARKGRKNQPLTAKPCQICEEAIKLFGIKNVFYT